MNRCTTHHPGCECHQQKIAVLIKASLDAAKELDDLQSIASGLSEEQRTEIRAVVERTYAACEALGEQIGEEDEAEVSHEHVA